MPIEITPEVLPADAATETTSAALLTELQLKADLTETQPVSAASLPLPSGAATSANQLADGHDVNVQQGNADVSSTNPLYTRPRRVTSTNGFTHQTSAYAANDTCGSLIEITTCALASGGTGLLEKLAVISKSGVGFDALFHFYSQSVTLSADNAAWSVSAADSAYWEFSIPVARGQFGGLTSIHAPRQVYLPYACTATSLFVGIQILIATTFTTTTDISIKPVRILG